MNIYRPSMLSQYIVKSFIQKSIEKIQKMIQQTPLIVTVNQPSQQSHKSNKSNQQISPIKSNKSNKSNKSQKSLNKIVIEQKTPEKNNSIKNYSHTSRILDNSPHTKSKVFDKYSQKQLKIKAEEFVNNLRKKKNQIEGKVYLLKQAENRRKNQAKRKAQIEKQVQAEIKKKIRKLNAQKNIQYFNQKKKLYASREALLKSRAQSSAQINESKFQKIILPPINLNDLQQIQQQADNLPESLKKTVMRGDNQKKRSKTQANMRQKTKNYSPPPRQNSNIKQIKQIKLTNNDHKQIKLDDKRKSYKQYLKLQQQRYIRDKKCYLMSKNFNAQQIADYLEKYENINNIISPKKSWAQKIGKGRQKNRSKYITRSRTNFDEQDEIQQYQQSQYEKQTTQRKFN